ncbi:hypothetical protein D0867_06373 [Hortaea werneckii]|uniref:Protein kinase domain-containing protein n=1 Tax=Hortaea werneckii TaxID=91943 RepID=A0A3M6ZP40_HORWE|nr:hypothetical protein D0867_06373 [Hortaea werneckii]RMY32383.1 hypothetical protein D0866_06649 [Hortaea werneckii]
MLKAVFYARFHPERGPSVIHQAPNGSIVQHAQEHSLPIDKSPLLNFSDIPAYIIPPYELCDQSLSICTNGRRVLGFPISIEDAKYDRNRFTFNVCFVLDEEIDSRPLEQAVRKTAAFFRSLEGDNGLLQAEESLEKLKWAGEEGYPAEDVGIVHYLLESLLMDLNGYGETCIRIDDVHILNLRLTEQRPPPQKVRAWDVPLLIRSLPSPEEWTWDLTLQRIHSYVNGVNHVQRIAELADVELRLVKRAVRELLFYDLVKLLDVYHYRAIYTPTAEFAHFVNSQAMLDECSQYVTTEAGQQQADIETIVDLYRSLSPGLPLRDFVLAHETKLKHLDIRRLITYGVIKGFLRRVHKYALAISSNIPQSQSLLRFPDASPSKGLPRSNEDVVRELDRAWRKAALSSGWSTPPSEPPQMASHDGATTHGSVETTAKTDGVPHAFSAHRSPSTPVAAADVSRNTRCSPTREVEVEETGAFVLLGELERAPQRPPGMERRTTRAMARAEAARAAADEPADEPANEPADEPVDEAADEPADESADEPTDEPAGELAHDSADEATDELAGEPAGQVEDEEIDLSTSASDREDNPTGSKRKGDEDMGARGPKRPRTSHQSDQASGDGDVGNSASRQDSRPEADEHDTGEETARLSNEALQDEIDDLVRGHVLRSVYAQQAQADHQSDPVRVASEASSEARYPPLPADVASRPADEDAEIESTKKLGYMEMSADPEEWNFVECLGSGTFGRACLWVKRNSTHTIIDRAVIKENHLERTDWTDDLNWGDNQVPWEAHIPARFIWSAFEAMARAACLMKNGSVINGSPAKWERLVHRDIKPANIFIMHAPRPPVDSWWPSLPLVKLGVFGMMVREDNKGYDNPSILMNLGTQLYCAPEQFSNHLQRENQLKYKLTPAADVFAIGKVVLCMMQLRNDTQKRRPSVQSDYKPYNFPEELERRYGHELVSLVKSCMRPNPLKRISPENLLYDIQEHVNDTEKDDEGTPTPLKFQLPSPEEYVSEKKDLYELLSR